jgi:nicotinate-nucleotide adenylyltransferase
MFKPELNTGLYFGSFNPVHNGHLEIAKYFLEHEGLDEIWFIVSPQNPLKESIDLADEKHRLEMMRLAVASEPRFKVSDVEFSMPKPSYTIDTLEFLSQKHPERRFVLIIGSDNLEELHLWKNYQQILSKYQILVYPRKREFSNPYDDEPNVKITQAPLIEISSTQVRSLLKGKINVNALIPSGVQNHISKHRLYTT